MILGIVLLLPVAAISFIFWFAFGHKDVNYSSFGAQALVWPLAVCAIYCLFLIKKKHLARLALLFNILGMACCFYLDYANYMTDYDTWLERGMPDAGEIKDKIRHIQR